MNTSRLAQNAVLARSLAVTVSIALLFGFFAFHITQGQTTEFSAGVHIQVLSTLDTNLNVRASASVTGQLLGTQPPGAKGLVLEGPVASGDFTWWKVDWETGADGWSVGSALQLILTPTPTPTQICPLPSLAPCQSGTTNERRLGEDGCYHYFCVTPPPIPTLGPCPLPTPPICADGTQVKAVYYTTAECLGKVSDFRCVTPTPTVSPVPTITPAPEIAELVPATGPIGATVLIRGVRFTPTGNRVNFGSGVIMNLPSADGKTISFKVPEDQTPLCAVTEPRCLLPAPYNLVKPGMEYGVSVTNSYGTSNKLLFAVTQLPSPTVSPAPSLTPAPTRAPCPYEYEPVCSSDGKYYMNSCYLLTAYPDATVASCPVATPVPEPTPIKLPDGYACTQEYAPVCATNGKTYPNRCYASVAGATISHAGTCTNTELSAPEPVRLDFVYPVAPLPAPSLSDAKTRILELPIVTEDAVRTVEVRLANTLQQIDNLLPRASGFTCTLEINPVCGGDGRTYPNACFAQYFGTTAASPGVCPNQTSTPRVIPVDISQTSEGNWVLKVKVSRPDGTTFEKEVAVKIGLTHRRADFNNDRKVDIFDFASFRRKWSQRTGIALEDITGDGRVDIFDFSKFVSSWSSQGY